jgi:hypothetical protein
MLYRQIELQELIYFLLFYNVSYPAHLLIYFPPRRRASTPLCLSNSAILQLCAKIITH